MPNKIKDVPTETSNQAHLPSEADLESAKTSFLKSASAQTVDLSKYKTQIEDNAEETKSSDVPPVIKEEPEVQPVQKAAEYSEIEKQAIKNGWVPKDEFRGDVSKWRDAHSWLDRKDLFERIDRQNHYIQRMEERQAELMGFLKTKYEKETNEQREILKSKKIEAIKRGDVDEVAKIEAAIADLVTPMPKNKENPEHVTPTADNSVDPLEKQLVDSFMQRNKSWFNMDSTENKFLTKTAIDYERVLAGENPNLTLAERIAKTERYMQDKFNAGVPANVPPTESKVRSIKARADDIPSFDSLPPQIKQIIDYSVNTYNTRLKNLNISGKRRSREFYIKELVKTKAIDNYGNIL